MDHAAGPLCCNYCIAGVGGAAHPDICMDCILGRAAAIACIGVKLHHMYNNHNKGLNSTVVVVYLETAAAAATTPIATTSSGAFGVV